MVYCIKRKVSSCLHKNALYCYLLWRTVGTIDSVALHEHHRRDESEEWELAKWLQKLTNQSFRKRAQCLVQCQHTTIHIENCSTGFFFGAIQFSREQSKAEKWKVIVELWMQTRTLITIAHAHDLAFLNWTFQAPPKIASIAFKIFSSKQ